MIQIDKNDIKILIIDDNPKNIQVAMNVLSKEGYHLLYAQDGKKGIELAKENDISLILLDILMPQMDGYEVCKELKNYYKTWDIPVIFLTVKDEVEDIVKGFEYGGVDYITKPFSPQILLKRVETHLKLFLVTNELQEMSDNLAKEIERQVEETRIKDQILFQQAKMASMGEMIANIAHQWRQPLSAISSASSGAKVQHQLGILTNEEFDEMMDMITQKVHYLSDTIDTFRDYIKENKVIEEVVLQERIDIALNIVKSILNDKSIQLINEVDYSNPVKKEIPKGELSQVIINIINNAKDILVEKKVAKPWVKIGTQIKDNQFIIYIEDNGGGIDEKIMPKIFDPYFTTKHKSQGTGLGLHMSMKIIKESLNGELNVINTKNGAKFFIKLKF